ncbi:hypothetical protein MMIC_P1353 [Mariprofundus micogutta]|uniref:DUF4911 domain-containing protein n=1 Tax=Mariprofundus micogutta TaxID=1921010 RepID=A0A1L8CN98_9PROT|nr:DUF4911 domain-containing protein [Mariprofundus micogutta]GAV20388.1 hypothetical protein MMIC_P1353 [Mariprofundus micogutta]
MASKQTLIIEVKLSSKQTFIFQSLLEAEEGLAVMRCFDPEHKKQQLWTTPDQRGELLEWLSTLPEAVEVQLSDEWVWRDARSNGGVV